MPIQILMPALSPTMKDGNLVKWLKNEGDTVASGDIIAEIETDKAIMEVQAIDEGVLGKIIIPANTKAVKVNEVIALLLEDGESADALTSYASEKPKENNVERKNNDTNLKESPVSTQKITHNHNTNDNRVKATPLAKVIAGQSSVDLKSVHGTGPYGRIVKDDVLSFIDNNYNTPSREDKIIPHTGMRAAIAKRLTESKRDIPHFYLSVDCNIDKLLSIRSDFNLLSDKYKISVNDMIIKASALSLFDHPKVNASWTDDHIIQYGSVDVSVAVSLDDGLITPIIKNANSKNIVQLSNEMKNLAKKAKENKLSADEFQGGGFCVSNLGMYGITAFSAIINPPQSSILAVGAGRKVPIVNPDNSIGIANIMTITLSCDHRVVDGVLGAAFLDSIKKYIENPVALVI